MTSNPQSRRQNPLDITSPPSDPPLINYSTLLHEIDRRIHLHEIRVALVSALIGTPLLAYILLKLNSCS
jgi:hypothetical protein